jgi:small basic protein (TIGR04137 family)
MAHERANPGRFPLHSPQGTTKCVSAAKRFFTTYLSPIPMSQHPSLKSGGGAVGAKRSVLKRFERVKLLKKRGLWKEGQSALNLPKTTPDI